MVNLYWVLIGTSTLNYALKKIKIKKKKKQQQQQTKNQQEKFVRETVNLCSRNLTKPKKKFSNTTKCHNIFTISLFSIVVGHDMIFYYFILKKCYIHNIFTTNFK